MKYWIGVVSKEHVMRGVKTGIAQIGHGKRAGLARMKKGDWLIYYSPKSSLESKDKLRAFTAIGQVADDTIYQVTISATFQHFRRKINYKKCQEVPILTLLDKLTFIPNKQNWGYVFRYGLVEIPKKDFELIGKHMLKS